MVLSIIPNYWDLGTQQLERSQKGQKQEQLDDKMGWKQIPSFHFDLQIHLDHLDKLMVSKLDLA